MTNFYKLSKYRKFLIKQQKNKFQLFNKKYLLICDFNNFNGLGLKLLKLVLFKNNFNFKLYKYLLSNFYINKNLINSHLIYFQFNKFNNIIKFIENLKNFSIIPFFCFPLFIVNKSKNIVLPINKINFKNILYILNKTNLIKVIFIKFIKKLLISYIIKFLIKLKRCPL